VPDRIASTPLTSVLGASSLIRYCLPGLVLVVSATIAALVLGWGSRVERGSLLVVASCILGGVLITVYLSTNVSPGRQATELARSAGSVRGEAPERVAVRRQHLSFRSPLSDFHNGLAATLEDVVALYQTSLGFVFTRQEAADPVAFLQAL
jgi:hypothetical protein